MAQNLLQKENDNPSALELGAIRTMRTANPLMNEIYVIKGPAALRFTRRDPNNRTTSGLRGRGESWSAQEGGRIPVHEATTIIGGKVQADIAEMRDYGVDPRNPEAVAAFLQGRTDDKIDTSAQEFARMFLVGDPANNLREVQGLKVRCAGSQIIYAQDAANGANVVENDLERLKALVRRPTHWVGGDEVKRQSINAMRNGSGIRRTTDEFGNEVTVIAGLPFLELKEDQNGSPIITFDETRGSSNVTGSLYCVSLGKERDYQGVQAFEAGPLEALPPQRVDTTYSQVAEWQIGLAQFDDLLRDAARLAGITKASGVI